MFGFGSDNKEKLKENMEEIKELIDKGDRPEDDEDVSQNQDLPDDLGQQSPDTPDFGQGQPSEDSEDIPAAQNFSDTPGDSTSESGSGQQSFDEQFGASEQDFPEETGAAEEPQPGVEDIETEDRPHVPDPEERGAEEPGERFPEDRPHAGQSQPEQPQEPREQSARETAEQGSGNLDAEIPKPPETREINVPEIEKGPLFIRRQKFERAREMITEMLYQAQEMEDVVNHLESGLQRDHETEREIKDLVHHFEDNRGQVEDIISPGEE